MNGLRKLNPRVLIIAAVILSLICAGLIYKYLKDKEAEAQKAAQLAKRTTFRSVVVTTKDIEPGVTITADMVKVERMEVSNTLPDAAISTTELIGKEVHSTIAAGRQVPRKEIVKDLINAFVANIPKDKRAITLRIDDPVGFVAGFVKPGTRVDIISYNTKEPGRPASGKMVLQDVLVLAMGSKDIKASKDVEEEEQKNNAAAAANLVTVAVTPRDAVMLRVVSQESKLTLVLRPKRPSDDYVVGTRYEGQRVAMPMPMAGMQAPQGNLQPPVQVIRGTNVGR